MQTDIYRNARIRKVDNGWVVEFYRGGGNKEAVFSDLAKALEFIKEVVE